MATQGSHGSSTVIVAGPVFVEWYWGPFFFALFFGPFILPVAAISTWILARRARRRGHPLTRPRMLALSLGLTAAITLLVLGGLWAKGRIEERRLIASRAAQLTFQTYEPAWIFDGYEAERARPMSFPPSEWVDFSYHRGDDYIFASQGPLATEVDPSEAGCGLRPVGLSSGETVGSCRSVSTEGGREVRLTELEGSSIGESVALIELGTTIAYVVYSELSDEAAVRYLDSLRPVAPEDMNYFGGY